VREILGVRYCLTGTVHLIGTEVAIAVELVDIGPGTIVWAEVFQGPLATIHDIRERSLGQVLSALEVQIPLHEAEAARLIAPEDLTAWSSYHVGLRHVFRFNRSDNAIALNHFKRAAVLQPEFARAHAAISFARFQNAFLKHSNDVVEEATLARRSAEKAVELDELDPFASLMMGRAHWLRADLEGGMPWLERSISLSPNYALAIYSQAWAQMVLGRPGEGQRNVREAMRLSPIDPMRYAMVATDAMTHCMLGNDAVAAELADRAAREPRAHVLIAAIAAACQHLKGNHERAQYWAADVASRAPQLTQADFFRSFPFTDTILRLRFSKALSVLGI
jgi:tetratricopeptide (TPR) repeat protein